MTKRKKTDKDLPNITQKSKYWATGTRKKNGGEFMCFWMVRLSTNDTRHATGKLR